MQEEEMNHKTRVQVVEQFLQTRVEQRGNYIGNVRLLAGALVAQLEAAEATEATSPSAPDMVATVAAQVAGTTLTVVDITTYAGKKVAQAGTVGPLAVVGRAWALAMIQFIGQNPDPIIKLLRDQLDQHLASASELRNAPSSGCSGSSNAFRDELNEAHKVRAMLDFLADTYGDSRVWGADQTVEAQTGDTVAMNADDSERTADVRKALAAFEGGFVADATQANHFGARLAIRVRELERIATKDHIESKDLARRIGLANDPRLWKNS